MRTRDHRRVVARRRRLALAVTGALTIAAMAAGVAIAHRARGSAGARASRIPARTVALSCPSPSLGGTLPVVVYLPAGYDPHAARYRVVYFLHGLPAGPGAYQDNAFVAQALATAHRRAIVVAAQGSRAADSDREYLDWGPNENWPSAIADDMPRCIDARYHTVASRSGRALIGLSAGGYGAFNIGLRNLGQFGAVESWSGYFQATDPAGDRILDLGSGAANGAATVPAGATLAAALAAHPALIAFYVGDQDTRFLAMNREFDASLRAAGVAHTFRVYPGGHTGALWRSQAPAWLTIALSHLASLTRRPTAADGGAAG
jgi:putative tributyrin esterase